MNIIETTALTKKFKGQIAVNNLNMEIPKGVVCGFLGKNGAGKTTTIKMLAGLTKPTSGSFKLNGGIGYLPDVPGFYNYMTAKEYLEFSGNLCGIEEKILKNRTGELLEKTGLANTGKKRIKGFSRGMKQRLGIAQALINKPEIVFMDEPISALDPVGRHEIAKIIESLKGETTVFFSTHIISDVESICDYIVVLDNGFLKLADSLENIKKNHARNTVNIKFFNETDSVNFQNELKNVSQSFAVYNSLEIGMNEEWAGAAGKTIFQILSKTGIAIESYRSFVPSLENIFMEVTK